MFWLILLIFDKTEILTFMKYKLAEDIFSCFKNLQGMFYIL